jgi:hypothetical protein
VFGNAKNAASRGVQLSVKLQPNADPQEFVRQFSQAPGVLRVTQTFPDERDHDLATLFVVEVDPAALHTAIKRLRSTPDVVYAVDPAPRHLIR